MLLLTGFDLPQKLQAGRKTNVLGGATHGLRMRHLAGLVAGSVRGKIVLPLNN
jgi:hypothetical protein